MSEDWDAETNGDTIATNFSNSVSLQDSEIPAKSLGRGRWSDEDKNAGKDGRSFGRGFRSHDNVNVGANYKNTNGRSETDNGSGWNESSSNEPWQPADSNSGGFGSSDRQRSYDNRDFRGRGRGRGDSRGGRGEGRGGRGSGFRSDRGSGYGGERGNGYGGDHGTGYMSGTQVNGDREEGGNRDDRVEGGYRGGRGGGKNQYSWDKDKSDNQNGDRGGSRGRGGRGRGRGGGGGNFNSGNFGSDEDIPSGGGFHRGGFSGRGGRGGSHNNDNEDNNGADGDGKPKVPLYMPPPPTEDEATMFESIPSGINFNKYEDIPVRVSGSDAPPPMMAFEESGLRQILKDNVVKSKYTVPTPVQKYAIPIIMGGRDLMACAQTGSGKTAAFLLPVLHNLLEVGIESASFKSVQEPYVIIMSPTRELATQIFSESRKFAYNTLVRCEILYGGTSVGYQLKRLEAGCHLLVATPGRLLDIVSRGKLSFSKLRYLILDEADKMLDMGFIPDIQKMVNHPTMPPKAERRALMFSATFPEQIQRLAKDYLDDYLFLSVGMIGSANADVKQEIHQVTSFEKRGRLLELLKSGEPGARVIIFLEQKRNADFLASYLSQNEFLSTSIHGDRYQQQREEALFDFKSGRMNVLVATAVASRGLDIKDVAHVINYDLPQTIEEYVHRIGRTGRVGNIGRATSFYDPGNDKALARDLVKILMEAQQEVPSWLKQEADMAIGTTTYSTRGRFGASDIRSQNEIRRNNNSADASWNEPAQQQSSSVEPLNEGESWD